MAVFSLEIADEDVERVLRAVSLNHGWRATVPNPDFVYPEPELDENGDPILPVPDPVDENGDPISEIIDNPETMGDFTHRMVRSFLSEHVQSYEMRVAKKEAADAVDASVSISELEV